MFAGERNIFSIPMYFSGKVAEQVGKKRNAFDEFCCARCILFYHNVCTFNNIPARKYFSYMVTGLSKFLTFTHLIIK